MSVNGIITRLGIFSNRWYWLKLAVPIIILLGLCGYSLVFGSRQMIYVSDCMDNPEACDGKRVVANVAPVTVVNAEGFTVNCFGFCAKVMGRIPGLSVGQFVDVSGRFHKEGWLEMERFHVCSRSARWIKLGVSLIPLVVVGILLILSFGRGSADMTIHH